MTHFYDKKTQSFYIDEINIDIPADSIEITATQHDELHNAINAGCIIFDDLTYSEPPPAGFHKWDGEQWVLDITAETDFKIRKNTDLRDKLLTDASTKITLLQRAIKHNVATDNEKRLLERLELFTIDVSRIDTANVNAVFPEMPEL